MLGLFLLVTYGIGNYHLMGKFYKLTHYFLGLLCSSAFAVQALAVESTARVSTSIDAASGYRGINSQTIRTPAGLNVAPRVGTALGVSKYSQGIQQVMPGTVSVAGTKGTHPINMHVRATNATLKGGAKSLLKGGLAGVALTVGLDALLDSVDWVMGEGGQLNFTNPDVPADVYPGIPPGFTRSYASPYITKPGVGCGDVPSGNVCVELIYADDGSQANHAHYCASSFSGSPLTGYSKRICYYGGVGYVHPAEPAPVTPQMIDALVDEHYEPEPEDWPLLSPRIEPDDIEIYDLPGAIPGEPETIIEYDPQGNPQTTTVKQPAYDIVPRENPSPQPALDLETRLETRTYNEHGELTGITEATSTAPAGEAAESGLEVPTDCEFMPTICRFLEWFQEPDPELDQQPDIESLRQDLELERNFTVGSSTAGCPAPIQISLGMFPSVELSLQPLCDFVDLLRPLLLAFAFYFSARIVLRT